MGAESDFPGYPPALAKACCDQFEYAMRLRTGEIWAFGSAEYIDREWVHVVPVAMDTKGEAYVVARGVDVRVSDIVWVADAPNGS